MVTNNYSIVVDNAGLFNDTISTGSTNVTITGLTYQTQKHPVPPGFGKSFSKEESVTKNNWTYIVLTFDPKWEEMTLSLDFSSDKPVKYSSCRIRRFRQYQTGNQKYNK